MSLSISPFSTRQTSLLDFAFSFVRLFVCLSFFPAGEAPYCIYIQHQTLELLTKEQQQLTNYSNGKLEEEKCVNLTLKKKQKKTAWGQIPNTDKQCLS